eukprot:GHVN01089042.1.p1 GENE.GHVN01089042.1~~GHVN01089042.1.p1  ORF type:complete len:210 (+),score=36.07 GHVN01089042.1:697-1326(+)
MLTLQLTPLLINDNESDHPPNFTYHQGRLLDPEVFQGAFGSLISIHEAHVHVGLALPLDLITSLWVDGGPFCVTEKEEEMLLKGSHHTGTRDSDAAENGFQKTGSDTDPTPTTPTSPTKSPWMGVLDQSVLASYIRGSIIVRQPWASSLAPPVDLIEFFESVLMNCVVCFRNLPVAYSFSLSAPLHRLPFSYGTSHQSYPTLLLKPTPV